MSTLAGRAAIGLSPIQKTGIIAGCAVGSWATFIGIGILIGMAVTDLGWLFQ